MPVRKFEEAYVKICPNCKSEDIFQEKSTMQALGYLPTRYVCERCSYGGVQTLEVKRSELKDLKEEYSNKDTKSELIDTSYGKFEVRFWWKIAGPIIVLVGIFLLFYEKNRLAGIIFILIGILISYITYVKKRKLQED